jgi:hypothetical protein
MKLLELFLTETTEEDRAILSLSGAIANYIKKYKDIEPEETDYSDDSNYDNEELDIHGDDDQAQYLGTIGQLFDTPLSILNSVSIELQSDYGIRQRMEKGGDWDGKITSPDKKNILGLWCIDHKTIVLNKDYLGTKTILSTISHELRHALDDFKSDFKANIDDRRYTTSKIKAIRKLPDDDEGKRLKYRSQPAEINARFSQVLNDMLPVIVRAVKLTPENAENLIKNTLKNKINHYSIAEFFPHKENSREYKRFMKRAMDFVQKEKQYQEDLLKSKKD